MKNDRLKFRDKSNFKMILKGVTAFLLYFVLVFLGFGLYPFVIAGVDLQTLPLKIKYIYLMILECIVFLIIVLMYKDYFVRCFKDFKKNINSYFKNYIKYWFIILGLMMIANIIITIIVPGSSAKNQDVTIEYIKQMPIIMYISAVFVAPLIEESVFRLGIRSIFKNRYIFIIVSGILFGAFHVIGTYETLTDLLYIIPYSVPGIIFAYVLDKSDNIFTSMGLHFINNGVLMAIQIIALFLV